VVRQRLKGICAPFQDNVATFLGKATPVSSAMMERKNWFRF
jgi:hypothetical protein